MRLQALSVLVAVALQLSSVRGEKLNARHANLVKRQASATIPPLASITLGMPTSTPAPFTGTHPPGSKAPIEGAPVIPSPLPISAWPTQDKIPDTNSKEVQTWMKELDGFHIPDITPTKDSTCVGDPAAAADAAKRGWWTCGGYTRSTDIVQCPTKLDWGVSFDDGPSPYTPKLLQKLKDTNVRTTFFVVGSRVIERPSMLVEEYMAGHEISVHTWSHHALTTLTNAQIVAELGWTRKAIKSVLGVTPTTMRPPKGDIDDRVRAISLAMGLVPIMWTSTKDGGKFDTFDWMVAGGQSTGTQHFQVFQTIMKNATTFDTGFITLQHDLFEITVDLAVGYTLDAALAHQPKFKLQPIGECSKIPTVNLYRETSKNTTFPFANVTADINGDGKSAAFSNTAPLVSLALVGLAVLSMLI